MLELLPDSLATSSQASYNKHWSVFHNFMQDVIKEPSLPASPFHINLFITHLHSKELKVSSIRSHLSAIAFTHKLHNMLDPTISFITTKLLDAIKKKSPIPNKRLPITHNVLKGLINNTGLELSPYDTRLFNSLFFLLMYHACLRVSEVATARNNHHTLTCSNITITRRHITVRFTTYKHSNGSQQRMRSCNRWQILPSQSPPQVLKSQRNQIWTIICQSSGPGHRTQQNRFRTETMLKVYYIKTSQLQHSFFPHRKNHRLGRKRIHHLTAH